MVLAIKSDGPLKSSTRNVPPILVLMAGLPGVGKTTLANRLGQALSWYVIEKDTLKETLLTALPEEAAGHLAFDLAFDLAHDALMNRRQSVILDSSALYPFIVERAQALARSADAYLQVLLCLASPAVRALRLRSRRERAAQHGCWSVQERPGQFTHLPSNTVTLCTDGPPDAVLEAALASCRAISSLLICLA